MPLHRKYKPKAFESDGRAGDTFAAIYESMLVSPAWIDLTAQQHALYLACKAQYYAEKNHPNGEIEMFTMNQCKWTDKYGLYKKSNGKGFYGDMEALIDHGFIRCVQSGKNTRTKSVYAFSSMWRLYGSDSFTIPAEDYTPSMLNNK